MRKTNKTYAIQTKDGQTVRVIHWNSSASKAVVVRRLDTGRVELIDSTEPLKASGIEFDTLSSIDASKTKKTPIAISDHMNLVQIEQVSHLDHNVRVPIEKDEENFKRILTWAGLGHLGVIALLFTIGFLIHPLIQPEQTTVKIVSQKNFVRPQFNRKTVKVSDTKINRKKKVTTKKVVSRPVKTKKFASKKRVTRSKVKNGQARTKINVAKTGALGVLGGLKNGSKNSSGLNMNALNNSRGSGISGSGGAGGHQRALPGKGLVASGVGNGGKAKGSGGYGTRGAGGGRPGYGKMSMVGSSGAYFQPLQEEALIQGGLDRDQIHAVIQKNMGQVVYCYEKGLQVDPRAAGRVNVRFVIGGNGRVSTAKVASSSVGSRRIDSCIINKLSGWKFPKPHGNVNVTVSYPFQLRRVGQG